MGTTGAREFTAQSSPRTDESPMKSSHDGTTPDSLYSISAASHGTDDDLPSTELMMEILHQTAPMLHQTRYMESLLSPPGLRSPLSLRYIVLALAALTTEAYRDMAVPFYKRARSLAEAKETLGPEHEYITVAYAQCWCLMSHFEAEQAGFSRASISLSRSLRIAQILGLHLLDRNSPTQLQDAENTVDPTSVEEQRRTWWAIYVCDRFTCATTGWPSQIDDADITTLIPASDESFSVGNQEDSATLASVLTQTQHNYSSFAGTVVAAHIFHRTVKHAIQGLQRRDDDADVENGQFWTQLRSIDSDLGIMLMFLPDKLKFPQSFKNQSALFVNLTIHEAIICLLRVAVWKCQQLGLSQAATAHYRSRLLPAAQEIASIIGRGSDLQALAQNPLIIFSVHLASLVFLDDVVADRTDTHHSKANLDLLLHIMMNIGQTNPVASNMAATLSAEMEQRGVQSSVVDTMRAKASNAAAAEEQPFPLLRNKTAVSLQAIFRSTAATV